MTPDEFGRRLRATSDALSTAPAQLEAAARTELAQPVGKVSHVLTRTSTGVRVTLSGPGARRRAAVLREAIPARARENILAIVRRAR